MSIDRAEEKNEGEPTDNSSIQPQARRSQRSQEVKDMPDVGTDLQDSTAEETAYQPPHGAVVSYHPSRGGVKPLAPFQTDGVLLDIKA